MKRFVRVANNEIVVRGRLMTINSFSFDSTAGFPEIKAHVSATSTWRPRPRVSTPVRARAGPPPPARRRASSSSTPTPTPAATVTAP